MHWEVSHVTSLGSHTLQKPILFCVYRPVWVMTESTVLCPPYSGTYTCCSLLLLEFIDAPDWSRPRWDALTLPSLLSRMFH
jgi:hypothetical protein